MKKLISTICLAALGLTASAQISVYPQKVNSSVVGYSLPRTVIEVSVVQQREVIIRGPYARYASQYLGVMGAAMTDKETYSILSAELSWTSEPDPSQIYALDSKSGNATSVFEWLAPVQGAEQSLPADNRYSGAQFLGDTPFRDMGTSTVASSGSSLQFDRSSAVEKSEEQMASDAASTIFKLRQRRIELITGEQGENVFGEGLKAALEEIARLEEEYVSLFLGKRFVQTTTKVFSVTPTADDTRVVAFRFSAEKGAVAADDLSASPINIEISALPSSKGAAAHFKGKTVKFRIPALCNVKLWDGITIFDSEEMPIFQKGAIVDAPVL